MTERDTDQRWIKPAGAQAIRHPGGKPLAQKGERVTWSTYWQRRLNDGDVVAADAPAGVGKAAAVAASGDIVADEPTSARKAAPASKAQNEGDKA